MNRSIHSFAAAHDHTFAAITSSLFDRKVFVARVRHRTNAHEELVFINYSARRSEAHSYLWNI